MLTLIEHFKHYGFSLDNEASTYLLAQEPVIVNRYFRENNDKLCYTIRIHASELEEKKIFIDTSYFVGVDYSSILKKKIFVEPKVNNGTNEINVLQMLFEAMSDTENFEHLDGLYEIDFKSNLINIKQSKDLLTPFLLIQFIKITASLVKKGLKKSYYKVTENLNSKVKGKIKVNNNISQNIVKNRKLSTICEYEYFGIDTKENQFLKHVLRFISKYLTKFPKNIKNSLIDTFNYIQPAFSAVSDVKYTSYKGRVNNPLYSDYNLLFELGNTILKIKGFTNNSKTDSTQNIPPYWIDMSKLFELYVFKKLRNIFPAKNEVIYHRRFKGGKETDILLTVPGYKCVIDCKYKPRYEHEDPSLEDKRQLAGYCRLKSVYNILNISNTELVPGLIIYTSQNADENLEKDGLFNRSIGEYIDFYKLPISLPII